MDVITYHCYPGVLYLNQVTATHWEIAPTVFLGQSFCYNSVIMSAMASQITGVSIVCSIGDRWKWPVTRKMFPFDDVIISEAWPDGMPEYRFILHGNVLLFSCHIFYILLFIFSPKIIMVTFLLSVQVYLPNTVYQFRWFYRAYQANASLTHDGLQTVHSSVICCIFDGSIRYKRRLGIILPTWFM